MLKLNKETQQALIETAQTNNLWLEGALTKYVEGDGEDFASYLEESIRRDEKKREKRLQITKDIQNKNKELTEAHEQREVLMLELQEALDAAESARKEAINDLDLLQKRTQFELIGSIVRSALWVIIGVGLITTLLYILILYSGKDTTLIENTWSNMFGILLTNSFSIIGTIMGVKYATSDENK